MLKKFTWLLIATCTLATAVAIFNIPEDEPNYDLQVETSEQKESVKKLISGSWFANSGFCEGSFDPFSVEEYTFGYDLSKGAINPVRYDKHTVRLNKGIPPRLKKQVDSWFAKCDRLAISEFEPINIARDTGFSEWAFLYYREFNMILYVSAEDIKALKRLNDLKSLPKVFSNS